MKQIGVLVKPGKSEATQAGAVLSAWLRAQGMVEHRLELRSQSEGGSEALFCPEELDLLVTIGGDGTLLLGARAVGSRGVPILGVNVGRLGFLTDASPAEMVAVLETWSAGRATLERRMAIDVELLREGRRLASGRVLNDAVISVGALARMIGVESYVDDRCAHSTRADGFIIATPTGSTAYNLAAGGPLVHPSDAALLLTPICPHTLSTKPIVIGDRHKVRLVLVGVETKAVLTLDGQVGHEMRQGDEVRCTRSAVDSVLVRTRSLDFFEVLRRKLGWGD